MENTMTDYKDRFFDQLVKTVDRIEHKVDANTELTQQVKTQAENTNGRVNDLEKRADQHELSISKLTRKPINPKNLTAWYRDLAVLRILTYLSLALLLLIGAAIKVDIGSLIQ